jgi:hypothetical protein
MQGTDLLRDPGIQKALSRSQFTERDVPELSTAIGDAYAGLTPEQKQALQGLADELDTFPVPKLMVFGSLLEYLKKNKDRYKAVVQKLYSSGLLNEGDLPEEYDERLFAIIEGMVHQAMMKKPEGGGPNMPAPMPTAPGYKKGGIVSLHEAAQRVKNAGRNDDTMLAHITPEEALLLQSRGGEGSINPATGLPEYGFFSSIGSFFKSAAPVVLPILGGLVGGPLGAAAGAGVGSLVGGASPASAVKSALFAGAVGFAASGVSSMMQGGSFMGGVTNALPESFGGGQNVVAGGGKQLGFLESLKGGASPAATPEGVIPTATGSASPSIQGDLNRPGGLYEPPSADAFQKSVSSGFSGETLKGPAAAPTSSGGALSGLGGLVDKAGSWVTAHPYLTAAGAGIGGYLIANSMNSNKSTPTSITKGPTGQDLLASNPNRYAFNVSNFVPAQRAPTSTVVPYQPGGLGVVRMATGGIAARGGKIDGPGTGTSDSIPARLSDGEFVMTAKAVRGAGGGDRMKGARRMYEIMHKYERMA